MADAHPPCIDQALIARASAVVRRLKQQSLGIVTAESCTAGLVSAVLSQAEGAGDVLHGSFVTYTKANKTIALGVSAALLASRGSVNEDVARALARGALQRSPADLALAITGVLGPEPDDDGNPVGLIFFACCHRGGDPIVMRRDYGDKPHDELRRIAVLEALALIEFCASGSRENLSASANVR
ncbi:MAG TPA: CinA family protein [Micropepsaceae bacterium]|jgi:nicotinamide-nucleotide amidase|nr:CinA family protein [Micropepsaceae bacterium]